MPRPTVESETLDAVNALCQPHFRVDVEELAFDKKIRFLVDQYRGLEQELEQVNQSVEHQSGGFDIQEFERGLGGR